MKRLEIRCVKTGRWWRADNEAHARHIARRKGLADYEIVEMEAA